MGIGRFRGTIYGDGKAVMAIVMAKQGTCVGMQRLRGVWRHGPPGK